MIAQMLSIRGTACNKIVRQQSAITSAVIIMLHYSKTYDKICALAQTKLNTLSVIQSLFSQMTFIHKTEPITRSHGSVRVL